MENLSTICRAAVVVTAALFVLAAPAFAENIPVKVVPKTQATDAKDPCGGVKIERNRLICQQGVRKAEADMEISRLITDINYALKSGEAKKYFEGAQESWATYMEWSCIFESYGTPRGIGANIDEENCRISYMESRIKHLRKYLGCIGTPPCPQ